MPTSPSRKYTIPVFGLLSFSGFWFIVLHFVFSRATAHFFELHKTSQIPLEVSHIKVLDKFLTPLVSFFAAAFSDPTAPSYPTAVAFVWSFGAAVQIPLIESVRTGVTSDMFIAYPMVWGILYQRLSGAWILPLWLMSFMNSKTRAHGARVERIQAEGVLAGWWLGNVFPAIAMVVPGQAEWTRAPAWVAYPVLIAAGQHGYVYLRTRLCPVQSKTPRSGYAVVQLAYLTVFLSSTIAHFHAVILPGISSAPNPSGLIAHFVALASHLWSFFIPASGLRAPLPEDTSAASGIIHFVKWDMIIAFGAVWLAGIWDAVLRQRDARKDVSARDEARLVTGMGAALLATTIVLGPGAATSGFWAYREAQLERVAEQKKLKHV